MKKVDLQAKIEESLSESAYVKLLLAQQCVSQVASMSKAVVQALKRGKRVVVFGNGGSAADAQHIAAEMEGRFKKARSALPVLALTTNSSTLTAVGNDFGYDQTFSRQVEAHVRKGDVVLAISTSGNSANVIAALKAAKKIGAVTIGFTNEHGGKMKKMVDHCLTVPSRDTQRVQECHIAVGHVLCECIEDSLF